MKIKLTGTDEFPYYLLIMLAMMVIMTYLTKTTTNYYLKQIEIQLDPKTKRGIKCLVSVLVSILTGYVYLLYLLLLR